MLKVAVCGVYTNTVFSFICGVYGDTVTSSHWIASIVSTLIQDVSGGTVNILGGGSMDYSE